MQETHSTKRLQKRWRAEWGGRIFFTHGQSNSKGVCILFKRNASVKVLDSIKDTDGRILGLKLEFNMLQLFILNIYAPNDDNVQFYLEIAKLLENSNCTHKMLIGDFNLFLDKDLDRINTDTQYKKAADMVKSIMEEFELIDVWREQNPDKKCFTCRRVPQSARGNRIDYVLISQSLFQFIVKNDIIPGFRSDHQFLVVGLSLFQTDRGKGFWKMNCTIIKNPEFIQKVSLMITEECAQEYESAAHRWEIIKFRTRCIAQEISIHKSSDRKNRLRILERKLKFWENPDNINHTNLFTAESGENLIVSLRKEIEDINALQTKGSMLRCKRNWYEYGQKSSKYFFNLEKHNYNTKTITRLRKNTCEVVENEKAIQQIQFNYFSNLYRSRLESTEVPIEYFDNLQITKISDLDREKVEEEIQLSEIGFAIKNMSNGKCPGSDGIPVEFYKFFYRQLKAILLGVYRYNVQNRSMHCSAKFGLISLIPKQNRDPLELANWRPISLLNVDYKILAKLIANRLQPILQKIIHSDQVGFIRNRFIGENLTSLAAAIDFCYRNKLDYLIVSCDIEKAFDSLEPKFVDRVLNLYNFGPYFQNLIRTLRDEAEARVLNNGKTTETFNLSRGSRQGCPLSSLIFNLCYEILSQKIRQNDKIEGLVINGLSKKLSQFADDMWNIIKARQACMDALIKEYDAFAEASGLTMNYDKTLVMRLGSLVDSNAKLYTRKPLVWTNGPIKVLGIDFYPSPHEMIHNYEGLLTRMYNKLLMWKNRALNPFGKVLVCNTLAISQTIYKLMNLMSPPEWFFVKVRQMLSKFIWDNKPPKVSYFKMVQHIRTGGMKLIDLKTKDLTLKLSKIRKILIDTDKSWVRLLYETCQIELDDWIWEANFNQNHAKNLFGDLFIWNDLLSKWASVHFWQPKSKIDVLKQILWYNSHILREDKPWCDKNMARLGILRIDQIWSIQENTFFSLEDLTEMYGPVGPMEYNSLISSIPSKWKKLLRSDSLGLEQILYNDTLLSKKITSNRIYWNLIENNFYDSRFEIKKQKWQLDLSTQIDQDFWDSIMVRTYNMFSDVSTKYFVFRLLLRLITTKVLRNKFDAQVSPLCSFCKTTDETVVHLFWHCPQVRKLWRALEKWTNYILCLNWNIDRNEVFLIDNSSPNKELKNILSVLTMQYIYSCKCLAAKLNFQDLIKKFVQVYNIEKQIAMDKNRVFGLYKKWKQFADL